MGAIRSPLDEEEPGLKAVIFDVDGTLAETEGSGHRVAYSRAFEKLGYPIVWDPKTYGALLAVSGGRERIQSYVATRKDLVPFSDAELDRIHEAKAQFYDDLIRAGEVKLRPGVLRLLGEIKESGLALALASTSSYEAVDSLLTAALGTNWKDSFAVLGLAEQAARKKPDPMVYEWVVAQLNVSPYECISIEDSDAGLAAAIGAGVPCLVTPSEFMIDKDFTGAVLVADCLGEPDCPADWTYPDGSTGQGLVTVDLLEQLVRAAR